MFIVAEIQRIDWIEIATAIKEIVIESILAIRQLKLVPNHHTWQPSLVHCSVHLPDLELELDLDLLPIVLLLQLARSLQLS